jgi:hypothetical protein
MSQNVVFMSERRSVIAFVFSCTAAPKGAHFVYDNQGFTPIRLVDPVRQCSVVARTLCIGAC